MPGAGDHTLQRTQGSKYEQKNQQGLTAASAINEDSMSARICVRLGSAVRYPMKLCPPEYAGEKSNGLIPQFVLASNVAGKTRRIPLIKTSVLDVRWSPLPPTLSAGVATPTIFSVPNGGGSAWVNTESNDTLLYRFP